MHITRSPLIEEVDAVVEAVAHQPHLGRGDAILVPTVEQLGKGPEAGRIHGKVAIGVDQGGAHAHGRTGKAVAGAVDGDGVLHPGRLGDLLGQLGPLFPGCAFARQLDARLVKEGLVDVGTGHRQSIGEAVQPICPSAAWRQHRGREVVLIVGRIGQVGPQVQQLALVGAKVGDAGQVGPFAGLHLDGQLLVDGRSRAPRPARP